MKANGIQNRLWSVARYRVNSISGSAAVIARAQFSTGAFAGASDGGTRTSVAFFPLHYDRELTAGERRTLIRKSRFLRNNLGLTRRFFGAIPALAVGRGMVASAATQDTGWNAIADRYFDRWAASRWIDVTARHNFYTAQPFLLGEMMCDGEAFALKVRATSGFQQLQFFKSHQIGDPLGMPGDGFLDGVRSDSLGKALGYRVLQNPTAAGAVWSRDFSSEDMLHLFNPERINQNRGLPWMYHGMNSCIDILDLVALEKAAVKVHSYFAAAIKRPQGPTRRGAGSDLIPQTDANGAPTSRAYEQFLGGGAIPVLESGEEFQFFTSDRPAITFAGFIDFLVRDIAWGFGVSPEFVWNIAGMGGANTRYILEDADRFLQVVQAIIVERFCQPVYSWVIADAIMRGELPVPNDDEWWTCNWTPPPRITADRGRDGKLLIELLLNGMLTLDEYWSMLGKNPREMRRRRIDEIAEDVAYCGERGVPYNYYVQRVGALGASRSDELQGESIGDVEALLRQPN